ncbi:MAG: 2-C-methyl-D-erythritol 2,4-cyclodiphosphate synthase [SAR86 cluster bacterium]|jgi:2-C-methyl-D-erythritol 2,4-cyclodiphosphate synthase|nr:2-C-methyl-D-erythritol 2,4-cyclodiphosphate synthase [SAR86 cluster bacterium]
MRIGHGFDVHKIVPGKGMTLGGIFIPSKYSIEAYSDGDIIIHALADALLGALAMGDIGQYFPSNDPKIRDISSSLILDKVANMVLDRGFSIENIDVTLILEEPKMSTHLLSIRKNLSEKLNIDIEQLSCKATTTDGLGPEGESLGISCHTVVLLSKLP